MKREYVVIDETGHVSYDKKGESPQTFSTFKSAKARSVELAAAAPGETVRIYELTAETEAPVGEPLVSRAHPLEHYR